MNLVQKLRALFPADEPQASPSRPHDAQDRALAAAALLAEAVMIDGSADANEIKVVVDYLTQRFGFSATDAEALLAEARRRREGARELATLTAEIVNAFDEEERIALIELLWEVSYADGTLHDYEANLLRRVGGLIYVSDRDRGAAQRRVKARLGIE